MNYKLTMIINKLKINIMLALIAINIILLKNKQEIINNNNKKNEILFINTKSSNSGLFSSKDY